MQRFRPVKKYGSSWVIKLAPADLEDMQLEEGELLDISDCERKKQDPSEKVEIQIQKKENGEN